MSNIESHSVMLERDQSPYTLLSTKFLHKNTVNNLIKGDVHWMQTLTGHYGRGELLC